ncbi:MAG: DUF547 domain-containing protein [Sedimentisphaerales bacterium]|nr:DUF547 domain-containing protein [Sedimentisphaerales bacterium]
MIDDPYGAFEQLLHNIITDNNRVDYARLAQQEQATVILQKVMQIGADGNLTEKINAYNAAVLYAVLESYPFVDVQKANCDILSAYFTSSTPVLSFNLFDLKATLTQEDWRAAFTLAGPRRGDAPLTDDIYMTDRLDEQLSHAVERYLGSCAGVQIDHANYRVLFGELIWNRREWFIADYDRRYGTPGVSLLAAVMPWASVKTQEQLADVPGYDAVLLPMDWRLNDLDRPELEQAQEDDVEFLPCGCP